jgi:hypothetical protein
MASTSSSLDPTLDESAMLRTESLVYSGIGAEYFLGDFGAGDGDSDECSEGAAGGCSAGDAADAGWAAAASADQFEVFWDGGALNGRRQAFLLQGEDVYLAAEGDIVARKYRIVTIGTTSNIQVEDLVNKDTQTLPLMGR